MISILLNFSFLINLLRGQADKTERKPHKFFYVDTKLVSPWTKTALVCSYVLGEEARQTRMPDDKGKGGGNVYAGGKNRARGVNSD